MSSAVEIVFLPVGLGLALGVGVAAGIGSLARDASQNAELRQQRARAAAAARDRAVIDHEALRRRVENARQRYGDAITPLPPLDLPHDERSAQPVPLGDVHRVIADAEQRLRAELAVAGTRALIDSLGILLAEGDAGSSAPGSPTPSRTRVPGPAAGTAGERALQAAQTVSRVLGRLETAVPADRREQLERRAAAVLAATPGETPLLLTHLRTGVQEANEQLTARLARLERLHSRLDLLGGPAVEDARQVLRAAADDPEPDWPAVELTVDRAVDEAVAAALVEYTATAVQESLQEIGLELEEGFETLLVDGGVAHVRRPGWQDVAVRVRRTPDAGADAAPLRLNLITTSDAPAADEATERAWCGAVDELIGSLLARGVAVQVRDRAAIGEGYVQPVARERFPFAITAQPVDAQPVDVQPVDVKASEARQAPRRRPAAGAARERSQPQ